MLYPWDTPVFPRSLAGPKPMNRLVLSVQKRILIPAVLVVAVLLWLGFCRTHYESYWNGTIHRVQTVDFNILHHTLPACLSQLILAGKTDEIQKVLNSSYGIFGMVVTDPSGKEILFRTTNFYQKETWQPALTVDFLQTVKEPCDLLCDPPPLAAQFAHNGPRMDEVVALGKPEGRVIGRLYYVRGVPPAFLEDLMGSVFSNWFEMRGSKRGYILLTLVMIGFATSFIVMILWRQRVLQLRETELQTRESELALRRKALDHLNADIASQRKRKEWLEQESELAYQRALRIRESLVKLKEDLFVTDSEVSVPESESVLVRPPMHKASSLIGEVESLLPELTHNARVLRSQAEVWQTYCAQLESRQAELQRLLAQKSSVAPSGRAAGMAEAYAPPENQSSAGKFS